MSAGGASNSQLTASDRVGISGLNDNEWEALKNILAQRTSDSKERLSGKYFIESWIIDTGASNHMTGCIDFLSEVSDMAPVMIKLPDGRYTISHKHGKVKLGSALILHDVFFVHELQCHLISVSQLTKDSGCIFQITDKLCVVQDRSTKTLIGGGEQRNGLYYLSKSQCCSGDANYCFFHGNLA